MNVLHVTPAFYPATYWGGPVFSTYGLCNALAHLPGVRLRVLTTDTAGPRLGDRLAVESFPVRMADGYDVYYCRRRLSLSFSPGLLSRLWAMVRWADVVHLTAVYSAPTIPTLLLCRLLGKPVVWSPRGGLQRWHGASRRLAKRVWEEVCDLLCAQSRVVLHYTSERERDESAGRIRRARAVVIPNGIAVAGHSEARERGGHDDGLRLLYLGRLHPIKGIENLLRAMSDADPAVSLAICGDGDPEYRRSLEALAGSLSLGGRVRFAGRVHSDAKGSLFEDADVCVLPSFSENFGIVVAEALAHGVPVITSRGTPWEGVEDVGCGLWVDNSPASLVEAIGRMRRMPLGDMGRRGREWMQREFSWGRIAERMMQVYRSLAAGES